MLKGVAVDGSSLVKTFVDDMLGSSFADVLGIKECVDDVGGFDHLDITDVVGCPALTRPGPGLEAHDLGGLDDEGVGAVLLFTGMDGVVLPIEGRQKLSELDGGLDDREGAAADHDDVHDAFVSGGVLV
jgi:hypothetical protein